MCGIAGIIHRGKETGRIGDELTKILQAMRHRGADSTGFAFYGEPREGELVLRLILAEQAAVGSGFGVLERMTERDTAVRERVELLGGVIAAVEEPRQYARLYRINYGGELRRLADLIEEIEGVKILSMGSRLELIKDLGDAQNVSGQYQLDQFTGRVRRLAVSEQVGDCHKTRVGGTGQRCDQRSGCGR